MAGSMTFETFFDRHYEPVVRSLAIALGSLGQAEEVAQDAFATALRKWRQVSTYDRPGTWVYVVAVRAAGKHLRDDRPLPVLWPGEVDDPTDGLADGLSLRSAIRQLAPRQRLAVVLRYFADLPIAEVGEVMGCSPGTVKSTLHTALERLRVDLETVEEEDSHAVLA